MKHCRTSTLVAVLPFVGLLGVAAGASAHDEHGAVHNELNNEHSATHEDLNAEHRTAHEELDGYAASHVAVSELQEESILPAKLLVRTNRYLNNLIEQDHRHVKQRVRPMLGFTRFSHAAIAISGIKLVHQMKKGPFDISVLCSPHARTPQIWEAVLAA